MKPYIQKLIDLNLLNGKGFALDLGSRNGDDAVALTKLGYKVAAVDIETDPKSALFAPIISDIRDFKITKGKYSFINANLVLPFISEKDANKVLKDMAKGLKKGGVMHFTLFGIKDAWFGKRDMHFRSYNAANKFIDSLNLDIVEKSTMEGWLKKYNGDLKYWNIHRYFLKKI